MMNGQSHWALERFVATIQDSPLGGECNVLRPADGMQSVTLQSKAIRGAQLLAPSIPAVDADALAHLEAFTRSGDLAAIYPPTDAFPFRAQAYWRLRPESALADASVLAGCELVASTQTDLLDSRPDITVTTLLPVRSVLRLITPGAAVFTELDLTSGMHQLMPSDGVGCLLYRMATIPFSYAEMVFPSDFELTRLELRSSGDHALARSEHHLFAQPLEKGVVLRSRILGLWMPSAEDAKITAVNYLRFADSPPPLTA